MRVIGIRTGQAMAYSLLLLFVVFLSIASFSQQSHISLGVKGNGICIGNSSFYNGLRLNLIDRNVRTINGFNIAITAETQRTNGLQLALQSYSAVTNGVNLSVWGIGDSACNGLTIAPGINTLNINGIGISVLSAAADTMNGFFVGGLFGVNRRIGYAGQVNGVALGMICGAFAEELNGVSIGLANEANLVRGAQIALGHNKTKELHGVQIGLWNEAENKRFLKHMPLLNFNFRREKTRM